MTTACGSVNDALDGSALRVLGTIGVKPLTVFDLDDTLLDYRREEAAAARALEQLAAEAWGLARSIVRSAYTQAKHESRRCRPSADYLGVRMERLCRALGVGDEHAEKLREAYVTARLRHCRVLSGALDVLAAFSERSETIVVLSNGSDALQHARVEASGLGRHIARVYTSERIGSEKPDGEAFEYVMREWHARPRDWRMVGDTPAVDLRPARTMGAEAWWVDLNRRTVRAWER